MKMFELNQTFLSIQRFSVRTMFDRFSASPIRNMILRDVWSFSPSSTGELLGPASNTGK